jgi:hypothetical protein
MSDIYEDMDNVAELLQRTDKINKLKQALGATRYPASQKPNHQQVRGDTMFEPIKDWHEQPRGRTVADRDVCRRR